MRFMLATANLVLVMVTGPSLGQDQIFRTVKAAAGKPLRLGLIGNVTRECTPGPMPEVKVVTPPRNGTLAIRSGKARAGSLKRCPDLEVPIQAVFYQANSNFSGTDEVVYQVKQPDGKTQAITIRVEVSAGQAPGAKADEAVDL